MRCSKHSWRCYICSLLSLYENIIFSSQTQTWEHHIFQILYMLIALSKFRLFTLFSPACSLFISSHIVFKRTRLNWVTSTQCSTASVWICNLFAIVVNLNASLFLIYFFIAQSSMHCVFLPLFFSSFLSDSLNHLSGV